MCNHKTHLNTGNSIYPASTGAKSKFSVPSLVYKHYSSNHECQGFLVMYMTTCSLQDEGELYGLYMLGKFCYMDIF